jgi:acyl-homoserine-lactone acylase
VSVLLVLAPVLIEARAARDREGLIRRDQYGVPHITGASERAVAVAHGYVCAEDHLDELARLFLRAQGRQAEFFGEKFVEEDLLTHRLGIHRVAAERIGELPAHIRAILDGYAEGYNRYLAQHRAEAPAWAAPITGVDVLAHARAVYLLDFALDLTPWKRPRAAASATGSAMWMIGAARSESGRGLLLANPHLRWNGSHLLHEVHLRVPGVIDIAGATLIGVPVVGLGFNSHLGWTLSVNQFDADDVYELELDRSAPATHYLHDGRRRPLTRLTVEIRVKTPNGVETRTETLLRSHHGPVIRLEGTRAFAYRSASLDQVAFLTQFNAMAKARSLEEFRAALRLQGLPLFNIGYADQAGHVFYIFNGRVPVRPPGEYAWDGVVPGNTSRTDWGRVLPLERLPQIVDPASGYAQNTNDPPWLANQEQPIDATPYASFIPARMLSLRGQRSLELLHSAPRFSLARLLELKNDRTLLLARRLKPALIDAVAASPERAALAPAIDVLTAWDDTASADARGSELFQRWWERYSTIARPAFRDPWSAAEPLATPRGLRDPSAAVDALRSTVDAMTRELGRLDVPWGERHRFRRGAIDRPLDGVTGQMGTFRVIHYAAQKDGTSTAVAGDCYVLGVEFGEVPIARSVLAYSQSSRPASPHYADQSDLFVSRQYKPLWYAEADVQQHARRTYRPSAPDAPAATAAARP